MSLQELWWEIHLRQRKMAKSEAYTSTRFIVVDEYGRRTPEPFSGMFNLYSVYSRLYVTVACDTSYALMEDICKTLNLHQLNAEFTEAMKWRWVDITMPMSIAYYVMDTYVTALEPDNTV